jgi:hypothetical protein
VSRVRAPTVSATPDGFRRLDTAAHRRVRGGLPCTKFLEDTDLN